MTNWSKIEEGMPKGVPVILVAKYPNTSGWSDPVVGWMDDDGHFYRWHHQFKPTHYAFFTYPNEVD